jgi:hypothetical protein
MMRVTVEIWPGGDVDRAYAVAYIDIWNVSELAPVSDYRYECRLEGGPPVLGDIVGHRRSDGWAPLVRRVVADLNKSEGREP